jgi:hypothetical protein
LAGLKYPNWFVDVPGADHSMAAYPLFEYRDEIKTFLTKWVLEKEPGMEHTVEKDGEKRTLGNFIKLMLGAASE